MKTSLIPRCGVVVFGFLFALPPQAVPQDANKGSQLKVTLNYSGSGTVDEKHKIFVALWDSPAFATSHVIPVAIESTTSNHGVVTFSHVIKNPNYASAAFDPTGEWDGQSGPPPEGSSLGMYGKTPGEPGPIELSPGKTAAVTISFDDSVKMRSGMPSK